MSVALRRHLWPLVMFFGLALCSAGCSTLGLGEGDDSGASSAAISATQAAIEKTLVAQESSDARSLRGKLLHDEVMEFYATRHFTPAWTQSEAADRRAARVIQTLEHAGQQGLRSADYPTGGAASDEPPAGRDAATYDITITKSLLRYAHDVRDGRVAPDAVYKDVELPPHQFDAASALGSALQQQDIDAFLAALPPPEPAYRGLVDALARYRAIEAHGGWRRLSAKTAAMRARLAERLSLEDATLVRHAHPTAAEVKRALMRFQLRNGLDADGKVGAATLMALNVPVFYRIKEIIANMERWRWMPRALEARYIRVNVPGQSVDFVQDGKVLLHSKAVIGQMKKGDVTPILRTHVIAVVANPPWDIPDDIAARKILPHLRQNASYLVSRDMVLKDAPANDLSGRAINWRKVRANDLPYQIQQKPGKDNGLGRIMLDSPNAFGVYLHDTPAKFLFKLNDRERSHGCVRVEKIDDLASLALAGTTPDPKAALSEALKGDKTQRLTLSEPIPVYMVYWTASVAPDGAVEFRPDRYGRDRPLIARLAR